jgi:DNA-binding response OmpR family regulator
MKNILLVSHHEAFLERNRTLLNRAGFLIIAATSAKEALQLYREQPVDLVISMLNMPDMSGDQLCSAIRNGAGATGVPFILVCFDTDSAFARANECGANAWLTKPVHPERLLESVGRFLRIPTRRDYRAKLSGKVHGTRETLSFSGMTHNISVSGLLCETDACLKNADRISNLLVAIDSQQIVADGIVVRSESGTAGMYNYGVQFTSIPQDSRDTIERFVAALPQQSGRYLEK